MTHTQPEALRLADKYEIEGFLQSYRFAQEQWCRQAAVELRRLHARNVELEAQLSAVRHLRSLADTTAAWVRPVSELLGHISDVLPDNAFDKIDTVKWNAVSALVGATTQAAAALILAEIERMDRSFSAQAKKGAE